MIIVLNGPINSGKTMVAKVLWEKIPDCAHIEVDKIREFVDWMENEPSWKMSFEIALQVAKGFIQRKLNVIITYHISDKGFRQLERELKQLDPNIFAFTLKPVITSAITNRGKRELSEREVKRIKETYEQKSYDVNYGELIDNSFQTAQQTAEYIFDKVKGLIEEKSKYKRRNRNLYS